MSSTLDSDSFVSDGSDVISSDVSTTLITGVVSFSLTSGFGDDLSLFFNDSPLNFSACSAS